MLPLPIEHWGDALPAAAPATRSPPPITPCGGSTACKVIAPRYRILKPPNKSAYATGNPAFPCTVSWPPSPGGERLLCFTPTLCSETCRDFRSSLFPKC